MALPFFFSATLPAEGTLVLDEETSKHIVQVLRMKQGERVLLTDGKGLAAESEILSAHKRHCEVLIRQTEFTPRLGSQLTISLSLLKNAARFEWFLEKATELGVATIIPLICERTEKQHFRFDRFQNICKSAMLQSRQVWLPELHSPMRFTEAVQRADEQKLIAHCEEDNKQELTAVYDSAASSHHILIGPEGDFTPQEIELALNTDFAPVSLGTTRLRSETAGIYAAAICR